MKNVIGIESTPVITARYWPIDGGTTCTTQSAIAETMPGAVQHADEHAGGEHHRDDADDARRVRDDLVGLAAQLGEVDHEREGRADHEDVRQRHDIQHQQHHDRERQREVDPDQLGTQRRAVSAQHRVGHHRVEILGFEHLLLGAGPPEPPASAVPGAR